MSEQIHTDESLNGIAPGTELSVSEEKRKNGLDYVSKSRIKTYDQCKFKHFLKYWCEHRPPGTMATERGIIVHELFEEFHNNALDYIEEHGEPPTAFSKITPSGVNNTQWLEWLVGFWKFEHRRWKNACNQVESAIDSLPSVATISGETHRMKVDSWKPAAVEGEFWLGEPPDDYEGDPDYVADGPPVSGAPWMGKLDALIPSQSLPEVDGSGYTVLDYKTGSAPTVKYEGAPFLPEILEDYYREGEFYGMLAEPHYDIDAVAFFFPKDDELIVSKYGIKDERRFKLKQSALGMQERPGERDENGVPENFGFEPQNLCHWDSGKCWFYDICPSAEGKK